MELLNLLQKLNRCYGISGNETDIAQTIAELARPYVDEITRDALGNLFCHKKGDGPKIMFAAHMDSIGFIVTHIEEKGFLRVGKVGGINPDRIQYLPVRFQNGVKGAVVTDQSADPKKLTLSDLLIDIGAKSREEAEKLVQVGDTAVYDAPTVALASNCLCGPYMDNRASCATLLMAMERLGESDNDLWFVFTVQEELGLRGARPAAWSVDPDYGIAVDVTKAGDEPGAKFEGSAVLGGGAAIKVMDGHVISHPWMIQKLEALAKEGNIPYQMDVIRSGGTDAGEIHRSRCGVVTGGISMPCRYTHAPVEVVSADDVEACVALVAVFASAELEQGDK